MEQVYVFSSYLVDEGHVCEVVLPAFSYDCRDVFVIFTAEQLTSRVVVEYVVHQHYLPWMEDIRLRRTGSGEAVMCTTQDSDPDQYRVFRRSSRPLRASTFGYSLLSVCVRKS